MGGIAVTLRQFLQWGTWGIAHSSAWIVRVWFVNIEKTIKSTFLKTFQLKRLQLQCITKIPHNTSFFVSHQSAEILSFLTRITKILHVSCSLETHSLWSPRLSYDDNFFASSGCIFQIHSFQFRDQPFGAFGRTIWGNWERNNISYKRWTPRIFLWWAYNL